MLSQNHSKISNSIKNQESKDPKSKIYRTWGKIVLKFVSQTTLLLQFNIIRKIVVH